MDSHFNLIVKIELVRSILIRIYCLAFLRGSQAVGKGKIIVLASMVRLLIPPGGRRVSKIYQELELVLCTDRIRGNLVNLIRMETGDKSRV